MAPRNVSFLANPHDVFLPLLTPSLPFFPASGASAGDTWPHELDLPSLACVFSFLHGNYMQLSIRPLSKHFKQWVEDQPSLQPAKLDPSADIPPWALPALNLQQLKYNQKKKLMVSAAKGGQLTTLQWARQKGCPWDKRVTAAAAKGGNLAVLQWLRQEGCP